MSQRQSLLEICKQYNEYTNTFQQKLKANNIFLSIQEIFVLFTIYNASQSISIERLKKETAHSDQSINFTLNSLDLKKYINVEWNDFQPLKVIITPKGKTLMNNICNLL